MKYLFNVENLNINSSQLYSVEADSEDIAKTIFSRKYLPLLSGIDFETISKGSMDYMDVIISYLGPTNQIEEL